MWDLIRQQPGAFLLAVILHLALVIGVVINYQQVQDVPRPVETEQAIQARVIQELPEIPAKLELSPSEPVAEVRETVATPPVAKHEPKVESSKAQAENEAARIKLDEARRAAEQKRLSDEAARRAAEQKRLIEEAAKRKHDEEQGRIQEEKRKADEMHKRLDEERRRNAEAELRQQLEEEDQQQLAAEQKRLAAVRAQRLRSEVARYTALITQKVERNWIRPADAKSGFSCIVAVQLMPGGGVVRASVIRSCGNAMLDRSVEAAVYKSTPLPVPGDPEIFNEFRELQFKFKPG